MEKKSKEGKGKRKREDSFRGEKRTKRPDIISSTTRGNSSSSSRRILEEYRRDAKTAVAMGGNKKGRPVLMPGSVQCLSVQKHVLKLESAAQQDV
eukprot:scaffold50752_cov28-Prasinocladus_malaysianus.AAC.2